MSTVDLEVIEQGKIALVGLNRPDALNALNTQFAADLGEVVDRLHEDEKIRAVILTGKGRAFCAGGDLAEFRAAPDPRQFIHELAGSVHKSVLKMRGMNAPWVAAINGPCFGVGLSLACCCDLRVASTEATFSVGFTGVGLSPDSSLLYYLPKIVGLTKATEMTLLNMVLSAEEALEIHLVSRITEPEKLAEASFEMAKRLANMPTSALGMDKKMLDASFSDTLEQHLELELGCVSESAGTADFQEGCAAFFERRKPEFKGR
ncbi:MAG: enoyl-CoA hydratase/isomerase family protein [Desulfobacteraceae bacterium]|nr:enoyl-CoA hydratase/isomerase family protein [Desulfobacteraceae bacterium]